MGFGAVVPRPRRARASARRMYSDYIISGTTDTEIARFFEGLRATGCVQSQGPVQIEQVLARKSVGTSYVLYQGSARSGLVYGIVNELGNNDHPRNAFQQWIRNNTANGVLVAQPQEQRTYACISVNAAKRFISAIPAVRARGTRNGRQLEAKHRALSANGCRPTRGQFQIIAVHATAFISLGYESGENWTALTAKDSQGRTVGLIYDSSDL